MPPESGDNVPLQVGSKPLQYTWKTFEKEGWDGKVKYVFQEQVTYLKSQVIQGQRKYQMASEKSHWQKFII